MNVGQQRPQNQASNKGYAGSNRNNVNRATNGAGSFNNTSNNKTSLIEQQTNIQLLPNVGSPLQHQQQQFPQHFNYNPLYIQQSQHESRFSSNSRQDQHASDSDGKNADALHSNQLAGDVDDDQQHLLNEADEDVLNDIYHYSSTAEAAGYNKHQQQHCQTMTNFGAQLQRDATNATGADHDSLAQFCDRAQQNHSSTGYLQASHLNGLRKQQETLPATNSTGQQQQQQQRNRQHLNSSQGNRTNNLQAPPFQQQSIVTQQSSGFDATNKLSAPTNNGAMRQRRKPADQTDATSGRKRLISSNHVAMGPNFSDVSNGGGFQQQQFAPEHNTANLTGINLQFSSHTNQMDLADECLFVEYQTNRNSLGVLEELNSLNVTNCDSETFDEHLNMEDCFETNDDFQDLCSNDPYLNMLLMNSGAAHSITPQPIESNQSTNMCQMNGGPFSSVESVGMLQPNNAAEQAASKQVPSELQANQQHVQEVQKSNEKRGRSRKGGSNKQQVPNKQSEREPGAADSKRPVARRKGPQNSSQDLNMANDEPSFVEVSKQFKIATTNTNKRLLPKKSSAQLARQAPEMKKTATVGTANSSCMASPSSTSNTSNGSALSPSSSSQFDYQALRKKLKIDVEPQLSQATNNRSTGAAKPKNPGKPQPNPMATTRTKMCQYSVAPGAANSLDQTIYLTPASNMNQSVSNGSSIQKQGVGSTTYVIARPFEASHSFDAGTVYLRTSNGLVPVNQGANSGLSLVSLGTEQELYATSGAAGSVTDPSMPSSAAAANQQPLIINCLAGGRNQFETDGTHMTNQVQGPTSVIFQAVAAAHPTSSDHDGLACNVGPVQAQSTRADDPMESSSQLITRSALAQENPLKPIKSVALNDLVGHNHQNQANYADKEQHSNAEDQYQVDVISQQLQLRDMESILNAAPMPTTDPINVSN